MNWTDLARQVIGLGAPLLGTALGGPLGSVAGKILADVLNAPGATPETVGAELPSVSADKLAEAEARWIELMREEAATQRAALSETHQTIRSEMASDDPVQRLWRPLYAIELTLECAALWAVLVHAFWNGDVQTINALVGATALFIAYWGFRFGVLGVYISGRTREKVACATGQDTPGVLDKLAKALKRK